MNHLFKFFAIALLTFASFQAQAVYVERMPVNQIQPNGDTLHFFVTGDECYHRYHDAANYTIVQNHAGYWVYAMPDGQGSIQPSHYLVGAANPADLGLTPGLKISYDEWLKRRHAWDIPQQYQRSMPKTSGRNHGDYCNLVIFIRFADDTAYTRPLNQIDRMFSDSSRVSSSSVYNFFKRVSYNKLFVRTYYAPTPDSNTILSYQSPHPRAYYMPYNEDNTIGYTDYDDRTQREFDLLVGAVNYINDSAPLPTEYVLDNDNDGFIDNVNFVVKGSYTGWSDLLWPHKWNLYGHDVYINGKQVNTFNFALEGAGEDYFGSSTFCHEMFHSLGAPDLYRYYVGTDVTPVGSWDLMAGNAKPPQHMSAYLKYKYGNWLDSIPLITEPGTYTLYSVGDSMPEGNIIYRFPSSDPNQFYVCEYRDNTEIFETKLSGKGLLIYRIDTRFEGNAGYNGEDYLDEVWLFRPGSDDNNTTGQLAEAFFAPNRNRREFSPSTNPHPYLSDNSRDLTFSISDISTPGNTIRFRYTNHTRPANLTHTRTTTTTASVSWLGIADGYRISYRRHNSNEPFKTLFTHGTRATITGLESNEQYEWTVRALYEPTDATHFADSSTLPTEVLFHTEACNNSHTDAIGTSTNHDFTGLPFVNNKKYNYSQQIFHADELDGAKHISTISFHYAHTSDLTKTNCTIYLANTSLAQFDDTTHILPLNQLTQVYAGDLTFTLGWNEIVLDTTFFYNGTDNLLLALDDNSEMPSRAGHHFYMNDNPDQRFAIIYSSDYSNPNPADGDSIQGDKSRPFYRDNIMFTGCPINNDRFYACILSDNEDLGHVNGEGLYTPGSEITIHAIPTSGNSFVRWNDNTNDNPRHLTITQDTLIIAYFHSPVGIDNPEIQQGYVIATQGLTLKIYDDGSQSVQIFDLMGRCVATEPAHHSTPATIQVPQSGIYLVRVGDSKPTKIFVR